MADRYLLESGAPDGYLLEDGSGVLSLDILAIVNNANTTVSPQGNDFYRVTKTGGADASFNADAVGIVALTGDFLITAKALQTNAYLMFGVSTAPTSSSGDANLDRAVYFFNDGSILVGESGGYAGTGHTYTTSDYLFLKREGTTVTALKGATDDVHAATPIYTAFTALSGTVYFDSSIYSSGGGFDARAYDGIPPAPVAGKIKAWSGSAWDEKPVKVWDGGAWVEKPLKVWSGSAWDLA